jgi:CubicO group peptidase (beta-lactamase class C family)
MNKHAAAARLSKREDKYSEMTPLARASRRRFCLLVILGAATALPSRAVPEAIPSTGDLTKVLQPFVDSNSLVGAVVAVADKNKIVDLEAVGYADLATKKPLTIDSTFWIASMSKPITATAFMMLVDEGKISIDDPVEKYLPEFANIMVVDPKDPTHARVKPTHPILIREILSHTSGLPAHTQGPGPHKDDAATLTELAHLYAMQTLNSQPATTYAYTNLGPNLAGRIIEIVSGMPFQQFLQTRLFDPLGMSETTFIPTPDEVARLATAYQISPDKSGFIPANPLTFTYPLSDPKRQPMPAGGLFSTATDIMKFCRMLLNDGTVDGKQYLTPAAIQQMTTNYAPPTGKDRYGLCFVLGEDGAFLHAGGYKTYMEIDPKTGRTWDFMTQYLGKDWPHDGNKMIKTLKAAVAAMPLTP